jgi:O-succinylbenzoate synthase
MNIYLYRKIGSHMAWHIEIIPHLLQFKFDARTSRGAMQQHQVYYLHLSDTRHNHPAGMGECAPLPGLSPGHGPDYQQVLETQVKDINSWLKTNEIENLESVIYREELKENPALVFALETAVRDFRQQGKKLLYPGPFTAGQQGLPINGLVWMGDRHFMQRQIRRKLDKGYRCLKLKIGGLDFDTEREILQAIRKTAGAADLSIRLDANGAFAPAQALERLQQLAVYDIHSIEQPIRQGQAGAMAALTRQSPIPIALDEELIGIHRREDKAALLTALQPQYIILKPTLVGGMAAAAEWIALAEENEIGWWITSALESNIGLNAISQFTATYPVQMEQGLGTGQLYHNNIDSPLTICAGQLYYDPARSWGNV